MNYKIIINRYRDAKGDWDLNVSDSLKCLYCNLILIDAVQTKCGCRYCKECLDYHLRTGPKACLGDCNDCKNLIKGYITDKATNRDIGLLTVICLNSPCPVKDSLKNMSEHFECCEYRKVICTLCGMSYIKIEEKNHLEKECLMRWEECLYCKNSFTQQELNESHLNIYKEGLCSKYVAQCPNKCDVKCNVNLSVHLKSCKNKPSQCPYHSLGCTEMLPKDKVTEHMSTHSLTIIDEIQKLKDLVKDQEKEIVTLKDDKEKIKSQMALLKSDFERRYFEIEKNQKQCLSNNVSKIDSIHRKGRYIWKISNFSVLKDNASKGLNLTIISDSFYTDEFGYKMCLKIYPFGDGVAKGTHLSVFFVLKKGEYDDLQSWPFRNKVTLTIIDDFSKSNNHSDTFKPDARSVCYQKPQEEFNIASGSPKFISFNDLNRFLKHDTIYLEINVLPV